jgi:hypothetical protein
MFIGTLSMIECKINNNLIFIIRFTIFFCLQILMPPPDFAPIAVFMRAPFVVFFRGDSQRPIGAKSGRAFVEGGDRRHRFRAFNTVAYRLKYSPYFRENSRLSYQYKFICLCTISRREHAPC